MKTTIVSLILALCFLSGCSQRPSECYAPITTKDHPNDVLIIGDSVSIGYTPLVRKNEPGQIIEHNYCNARSTRNALGVMPNGKVRLNSWLNERTKWKLVTFNFGLHDVVPENQISVEQYKANLRSIVEKIKPKTDHMIFFTTTHVPMGAEGHTQARVDLYNAAALEVMNDEGVPVYDLGSYSKTFPELHSGPKNIHWSGAGSKLLADFVSASIHNEVP